MPKERQQDRNELLMDIPWLIHASFESAVLMYTLALACHLFSRKTPAVVCLGWGLLLNGASLVLRYWSFLPLMPLFQGPFFLPFVMGVIGFRSYAEQRNRPVLLGLVAAAAWVSYLFPNDFYLPYLQFKTLFAHALFIFAIIGKALFLLAGEAGLMLLVSPGKPGAAQQMAANLLWGFFFWTLSVFSGAVWSWLGWGSALVWDDPIIAVSMATWLLYALLLHLHLTRFSAPATRAAFIAAGSLWIIFLGVVPELGPFRMPGWLS